MSQSNAVMPTTLPVPTFCKIAYGIGENSSYAAAARGDVPTIKIGGLVRVPVRVALAKMAGGDAQALQAITADFAAKLAELNSANAA
jgi:hypothetical protein